MAKKKLTTKDRERLRRMGENAERTRRLAEKGLADLEQRRREVGLPPLDEVDESPPISNAERLRRMRENAERTRRLAEKAQAELDHRYEQQ